MPTSAAQIASNRANAQSSTGPTTERGKAICRQNAIRHNLCACFALTAHEPDDEAAAVLATLREEHQPYDATEEALVFKMAEALWTAERAAVLISEEIDRRNQGIDTTRQLSLYIRYQTTADRGFYRALNELRKLQKERRLESSGSVSQNLEAPVEAPPDPPLEPAAEPPTTPEIAPVPAAAPENEAPEAFSPAPMGPEPGQKAA